MATKEEVNANQITGVRVRFLPEGERKIGNRVLTRALSDVDITWREVDDKGNPVDNTDGGTNDGTGSDGSFG